MSNARKARQSAHAREFAASHRTRASRRRPGLPVPPSRVPFPVPPRPVPEETR